MQKNYYLSKPLKGWLPLLRTAYCLLPTVKLRSAFCLLVLFPLLGLGRLHAQTCVSARQVKTNYLTNTVTFSLTNLGCDNTKHLSRVWVILDYREVYANGTKSTTWKRATLTNPSTNATLAGGNKGLWVTVTGTQTVSVTLADSDLPARYDWCANALDYPPVADVAGNTVTFHGTPPFVVNGAEYPKTNTGWTQPFSSFTDRTGNPDYKFVCNDPTPILSGGGTSCTSAIIKVTNSQPNVRYQLRNNGSPVGSTVAGTGGSIDMPAATASGSNYTVLAVNNYVDACAKTSAPIAVTIDPTITATITPATSAVDAGATLQLYGSPAGTATWSSSNAYATVNSSGLVTGVTGGQSAVITYKVTTANGCTGSTTKSITIKPGCATSNIAIGTQSFKSTKTWTVGGKIWSDAVKTTYCSARTSYYGGTDSAPLSDCRSNGTYGDLFSWCMVQAYASQLCPSPWRVPTKDEFVALDQALGGTGANNQSTNGGTRYNGLQWGGAYGGLCYAAGGLNGQGSNAYYWSATEGSGTYGYRLGYRSSSVYPQDLNGKYNGFTLRCVRN